MSKKFIVVSAVIALALCCSQRSLSQASKQLDERAKKVATPQEQSWKQVDNINNEADRTKGRYQQSQQNAAQSVQKSGYTVKKSSAGTGYPYKKFSPPKQKAKTKKK